MSKNQMTLQRQNFESEMSSFFYNLLEMDITIERIRDRFDEMFPAEDKFFNMLVSELAE
jgi:hypothetical protein